MEIIIAKILTCLGNRRSFIDACKESLPTGLWSEFIDHPFVRGIANGTLPLESFIFYLKQDYLYLQHYARSAALAAYKGTTRVIVTFKIFLLIYI